MNKLVEKKVDGELISPVLPDDIKNYLIDIDGTICDDIPNEEPERMATAELYPDALETLNKWYDQGHYITFFTSRVEEHREVTEVWLKENGFKYHGLLMGKPRGGNYHWVDNHIVRATRFDGKFTDLVEKEVSIFKFLNHNTMSELQVKTLAECMAEGKQVDILFWVGSAGSFDDRAKKITRAFVQILNKAGVNFGVLGSEESSSGDAAKRAGNEFLFQMQAMMNIEVMNGYNVKRIVTTCPHSYNTLKNEYKGLGGDYKVQHHTEFIAELLAEGKLTLQETLRGTKITYHDPCYLGRANNVYDIPRELIKSLGVELVEMKRSKRKSFCCGAGGAQMFKEPENGAQDININRTEEALALKPDIIATGCPFCNTMMTDGVKAVDEGAAQVKDIAELIAENL